MGQKRNFSLLWGIDVMNWMFTRRIWFMCAALTLSVAAVSEVPVTAYGAANESSYAKLEETIGVPPVNARVDRVWHAIPGLSGWKIDKAESDALTREANDGKLHIVWVPDGPSVRLNNLQPEPIYRGPKEEKSASLMINVSWGEEYLPAMLKILADEHVKATFFLDGAWVKKHRDLARKIVEEGHDIGSHGYGHPDMRTLTDSELQKQVIKTREILFRELGTEIKCIAPPSGSYDSRLVKIARDQHMYTILWTADTVDWQRPHPDVIVDRVRKGLTPGALILMHPTAPTTQALPRIIRMLKNEGYHMKTVDEVVSEERGIKPPAVLSAGR
jgi:peptidoglycan-N-acetylglucosamine deacetylase